MTAVTIAAAELDAVGRAATQVRTRRSTTVHDLDTIGDVPAGRLYRTVCGEDISNVADLAFLTTRPATCIRCAVATAAGTWP